MKVFTLVLAVGLVACSAGNQSRPPASAAASSTRAPTTVVPTTPTQPPAVVDAGDGPFNGVWEECDEGMSPDECSRYVLVQRGDRVCGTWSYVATGDVYEGQVQATVISATSARRTRVCGRPGSATRTECADGWESIDKPLQLCDGKLAESSGSGHGCRGRYVRSAEEGTDVATLATKPWVRACLARAAGQTP